MSPPHPACNVARVVEARQRSSIASPIGECSPQFSRRSFPGNSSDVFDRASCHWIPFPHEWRAVGDTGNVRSTTDRIQASSFLWECFHVCPTGCHETCSAADCFSPNSARRQRIVPAQNDKKALAFLSTPKTRRIDTYIET